MKKLVVGMFSFLLLNLLILLAFNMNVKNILSDVIGSSGIDNQINNALESYFNKNDIDIVKKEDINDFIEDFIDEIIANDEEETSDILVKVINKNRDKIKAYGVSDEDIDKVIYEIEANVSGIDNNVGKSLSDEQKMGLYIYKYVSSSKLRNYIIAGIVLCCLIILLINRFGAFKDIGISLLSAGILIKVAEIFLNELLKNERLKEIINGIKFDFSCLNPFIYGYVIGGIILIIVYVIYYFIKKEREA